MVTSVIIIKNNTSGSCLKKKTKPLLSCPAAWNRHELGGGKEGNRSPCQPRLCVLIMERNEQLH